MLKLQSIEGLGLLEKERVVISIAEEEGDRKLDIGNYAVFACRMGEKGPYSGRFLGGYWFASKIVAPGDFVILYTKPGRTAEKKIESGGTSHFFYWGSSEPLWAGAIRPVVVATGKWSYVREEDFTIEPEKSSESGGAG